MQAYAQRTGNNKRKPSNPRSGKVLSLSESLSGEIQSAYGIDTDELELRESPEVAEMGANATAQGQVIRFAPGRFNPGTRAGRAILGHELSHVIKQAKSGIEGKAGEIRYDERHERASDESGEAFAAGTLRSEGTVSLGGLSAQASPVQGNWPFKKKSKQKKNELPKNLLSEEDKASMFEGGARTTSGNAAIRKLKEAYGGDLISRTSGLGKKFAQEGKFEAFKSDSNKKTYEMGGAGNFEYSDLGEEMALTTLDSLTESLDDEGTQEYIRNIAANEGGRTYKEFEGMMKKKGEKDIFSGYLMSILPTRGFSIGAGLLDEKAKENEKVDKKFGMTEVGTKKNRDRNAALQKLSDKYDPNVKGAMQSVDKILGKGEIIAKMYEEDPEKYAEFAPFVAKYNLYRDKALGIMLPNVRDSVANDVLSDKERAIARPNQNPAPNQPQITKPPTTRQEQPGPTKPPTIRQNQPGPNMPTKPPTMRQHHMGPTKPPTIRQNQPSNEPPKEKFVRASRHWFDDAESTLDVAPENMTPQQRGKLAFNALERLKSDPEATQETRQHYIDQLMLAKDEYDMSQNAKANEKKKKPWSKNG